MKYFNRKPTVGSRLIEATELMVNDEDRLRSMIKSIIRSNQRVELPALFTL